MHYSVLNGGKRLRPVIVYAAGHALNLEPSQLHSTACAIEFIHCYSIIHDDLPAMDNDDLRRGKPSCHKQFDEASAILAGDALQTVAFAALANDTGLSTDVRIQLIQTLTHAAGSNDGMALGQILDLQAEKQELNLDELTHLHQCKSGALIEACCKMPAIIAQVPNNTVQQLDAYSRLIGLAYQVHDDILDVTASSEQLGKTAGKDLLQQKSTFPKLLGVDEAQRYARQLCDQALTEIGKFADNACFLRELAEFIVTRNN